MLLILIELVTNLVGQLSESVSQSEVISAETYAGGDEGGSFTISPKVPYVCTPQISDLYQLGQPLTFLLGDDVKVSYSFCVNTWNNLK